jgi:hypothetical protein
MYTLWPIIRVYPSSRQTVHILQCDLVESPLATSSRQTVILEEFRDTRFITTVSTFMETDCLSPSLQDYDILPGRSSQSNLPIQFFIKVKFIMIIPYILGSLVESVLEIFQKTCYMPFCHIPRLCYTSVRLFFVYLSTPIILDGEYTLSD